jgi:hypothetical protein
MTVKRAPLATIVAGNAPQREAPIAAGRAAEHAGAAPNGGGADDPSSGIKRASNPPVTNCGVAKPNPHLTSALRCLVAR